MRRFFFAVFLSFRLVPPASAIFVPTQMERIDHEPLFDQHYFVSLLAFSYPDEWNSLWRSSTAASGYRINAASLDCCDLFLQQELRFQKKLTEGLAFKFRLIQQDDKERQETHHWLELEQRAGAGFSAAVFGEPSFHKGDSDIGFGLVYARGPFKARARRTFVDFDFNRRSGTNQNYARKPVSDEFSAELALGHRRLTAAIEIDHPLRRKIPDENRLFSYRRTTASLGLRSDPPGSFSRRLEYGYEFQRKGNTLNPDPAAASVENLRQVHRLLVAAETSISEKDRLELGHSFLVRAARTDFYYAPNSGVFYRRWEAQPYVRWRRTLGSRVVSDLGAFLSFGENRRRYAAAGASAFDGIAEAKLGAGLDFLFSSGRIGLYATGKLSDPSHPFGGGNARAMFFF